MLIAILVLMLVLVALQVYHLWRPTHAVFEAPAASTHTPEGEPVQYKGSLTLRLLDRGGDIQHEVTTAKLPHVPHTYTYAGVVYRYVRRDGYIYEYQAKR